ncbi:MAG: sugar ABC transporter ATP-binding protein [Proteobacteria bacterium]|nr:sugar ABC transporter ATP-binding protein [Pseudomonadota bacterium]
MWIELKSIHKHYGNVRANNGVSFKVNEGSIHAVIGENGAGKSTLMKVLSGYTSRTSGEILVDGEPVYFKSPEDATKIGIGMLYQDPMDFPQLTVLENFMLGQIKGFRNSEKKFKKKLKKYTDELEFDLSPNAQLKTLTIGERQQLEIIRLLSLGAKVIILDEPTTGISVEQKDKLFAALKRLVKEGKSVILVSHKIEDVEVLCDKITVLKQGCVTGEMEKPFDLEKALMMMFETESKTPVRSKIVPGKKHIEMKNVSVSGGRTGLHNCDVTVRRNEIIGLAGLEGSGQGVFLRCATGLLKPYSGSVTLNGKNMTGKSILSYQKENTVFLPTNRLEEGLIPGLTIKEHYSLRQKSRSLFVDGAKASSDSKENISKYNIKGDPRTLVESLSGGNQQRLLLSFIPDDAELLLLENPTRGLDIGSANWVWELLQNFSKDNNATIIFTSPEIDEILMIADRVLVFFDGKIIKDVKTDDTNLDEIGSAIAGKV